MSRKNVEDVYKLTPVQRGMLVHTLAHPGDGAYFDQFVFDLPASDMDLLRRTWEHLYAETSVLRTSFLWEDLKEPVQIVHREVEVPIRVEDWRGIPEAEGRERLGRLLAEDRSRPFDLLRPPLSRIVLIREEGAGSGERVKAVWSYHHMLLDAWSVGLLRRRSAAIYAALATGREPAKEARPRFRDYVRHVEAQDLDAAEAYWRGRLAGYREPLALHVDGGGARGVGSAEDFDRRTIVLEPELSKALETAAREARVTLFTLVQGAWTHVLARYGDVRDLVLGVTVSGRLPSLPKVEKIIGCLINTLSVRVRLPAGARLGDWLQELQRDQLEMRRYEYSPLPRVRQWSEVGTSPLFETLLVADIFSGDAEFESFQRTDYPLALTFMPRPEGLQLSIGYGARRFSGDDVAAMLDLLRETLDVLRSPARSELRLRDLPPAPSAELSPRRSPERSDAAPELLPALFLRQAERRPDAVALTDPGSGATHTYGDLAASSSRLAAVLRARGVGPEVKVALFFDRTPELVVAILGVLRAGGAYVPLDPDAPADRLAFILDDCDALLALTTTALASRLETDIEILCLDDATEAETTTGSVDVLPENLAYVIYTSGSTGKPKGVEITHAQVARLFARTRDDFDFGEEDVWTLFHSYAFDFSVWEIWGALAYGGRLVIVPREVARSGEAFYALLAEEEVTLLNQTPSAFQELVRVGGSPDRPELPALRFVIFGGEALDPATLAPWLERYGDARPRLVNMYGITETTVHVTRRDITRADLDGGVSPIGEAISDLGVELVDRELRPVPVGVAGEILVRGAGVARGYLGRPALTAERFVPAPSDGDDEPGARAYRSGDLAREQRPAGVHRVGERVYVGRRDFQVKIRGYRIELGEIEAALRRLPEVADTVAVVDRPKHDVTSLVAYLVPRDGAQIPEIGELRDRLADRLPDVMLPQVVVPLERFPLTVNGKVDRRALPSPERPVGAARQKPRTPTEERLAELWSELLGIEDVSPDDNFFELGGHSLLATQVANGVRQSFGVDLPLGELFERPTLAELAVWIDAPHADRAGGEASAAAEITARPGPRDRFPVSYSQLREWILHRFEPGTALYNIPAPLELRGDLDPAALAAALAALVRRHEALRTTFAEEKGASEPVQVVHPPPERVELPTIDLRALPEERRLRRAEHLAGREIGRAFDLERGSLVRWLLLRLAEDEHLFIVTVHHIVFDGWSRGVFFRELDALYRAAAEGQPEELAPLPIQYPDYAAWQRERLAGEHLEHLVGHWRERLAGAPRVTELPVDRPRPPLRSSAGGLTTMSLEPALAERLRKFSAGRRSTPFMVLLAALDAVLYRFGAGEDLTVGTFAANRQSVETAGLVGFFVNTLAIRAELDGRSAFADNLDRVRAASLDAFAHQELPFEKLLDSLDLERDPSITPLFQVLLLVQNAPEGDPALGELEVERLEPKHPQADFDLEAVFAPTADGGLEGTVKYARALFDRGTVERFLVAWRRLLEAALAAPETPLDELPLLRPHERQQLLLEWNPPPSPAPTSQTTSTDFEPVHITIRRRAAERPDAVAIEDGETRITYGDLAEEATHLADRLVDAGVHPGDVVALAVPRSASMVISILGVLQAGAAYLPLDLAHPEDRLRFVLEDAGVRSILALADRSEILDTVAREAGVQVLDIAAPTEELPTSAPNPQPESPAYIIYTSGSTGEPKGVVVPHRALAAFAATAAEIYGVTPEDRVLQFAALTFDTSVEEIFPTLARGATLVPRGADRVEAVGDFLAKVAARKITVLDLPTAYWHEIVAAGETLPESVRLVILGGEKAESAALAAWRRCHPERPRLVNTYGPSEATVIATLAELGAARGGGENGSEVPIGRPIPGARVHLLDRRARLAPPGARGEIALGGAGLATGYLGRPGLTAERFIPDPFAAERGDAPGSRLYRTGDLGRHRLGHHRPGQPSHGGELEFAGRIDDQVKLRGQRVEPGEVTAVLAGHPSVEATTVVARPLPGGQLGLVAFVVLRRGQSGEAAATLRGYLRERLPEPMVPAVFEILDALPMTPSRKVDRRELVRRPLAGVAAEDARHVAPKDDLERRLAAIWGEVLGLEKVSVETSFFEFGGDSLLILQLHRRLEGELDEAPKVLDLFRYPTVRTLAEKLREPLDAPTFERAKDLVERRRKARRRRRGPAARGRKTS